MKTRGLIVFFLLLAMITKAQNYSYLYIESNNKNPFYIAIDSNRYQRHFNTLQIVPELIEGPMMLSIQLQNQPKETYNFYIQMPPASHRSFLLEKNQENQWILFDLERNYSIHANKDQEDIELFKSFQLLRSK
jgi:hypothetical protein